MKDTLILVFKQKSDDIKTNVYRETLQYIADNFPAAEVYTFEDTASLLRYLEDHDFSVIVSTNEIHRDTTFLLKGLGIVQVLIGMRPDLLEAADIIVDPLVCRSDKYLVGTKYLLSSILKEFPADALAGLMKMDPDILVEEVNCNEARGELLNIVRVCQKLKWDSDFFGVNIGYISCLRLTSNIEKYIRKFIRKEKIDLLEYVCNCHDRESVLLSEQNHYSFVDMRLTFERFLHEDIDVAPRKGFTVAKGTEKDIPKLKEISNGIYKHSRYYFDENFDRKKVIDFYLSWIEKAIYGTFDDYAYVLYHNAEPIGFCSIKKVRKNAASISLLGLSSKYTRQGLGKYMFNLSLKKLREEEGVNYVEVVTQGRNYGAQRLYQKCGFMTRSTELWYHKWFH